MKASLENIPLLCAKIRAKRTLQEVPRKTESLYGSSLYQEQPGQAVNLKRSRMDGGRLLISFASRHFSIQKHNPQSTFLYG